MVTFMNRAVAGSLQPIARIGLASLSIIAIAAVTLYPSNHNCKLLVWGPRSQLGIHHDCQDDDESCKSCNGNESTCNHFTFWDGDWQVCQCLCGDGTDSVSDCHAIVQWNVATGQVVLNCYNNCCAIGCTDTTHLVTFGPNPVDPCYCDIP